MQIKSEFQFASKLPRHSFMLFIVTFCLLVALFVGLFLQFGGQLVEAGNTKVVQVYRDGEQQIVPTKAETVGDLLERLDIVVTEKDIVEPSVDTVIDENGFSINIYNSRPVLIVEGEQSRVVETAQPTPRAIAKAAGLKVYPEDLIESTTVEIKTPIQAIQDGLVAEKVVIDRAIPVSLNLYDNKLPVRTRAKTVGELLDEKNIKLKEGDTLEPAASTVLSANTGIFIVRHGNKVETKEIEIPAPVETIENPDMVAGSQRVEEAGAPGRKVVTYEIELRNGEEVARRILQEVVATPPLKRVVIIGTQPIPGGNGALLRQLRMCETGGNYQTDTGNGYYGAYQFSASTWNTMGTAYSSAQLAPPSVQDDAALRLARRSGFHSQFPGCSAKLSLPAYPY